MKTPRVKLVPPRLPASHVRRPALERMLEEAEQRRLALIVAGAGFGKSTLAASVAIERGWSWYRADGADSSPPGLAKGLSDALHLELLTEPFAAGGADALGNALAQALDEKLHDDVVLVIDDVHELGGREESARVLETLVRLGPPELHLVLCTRKDLPFPIERLRGQGDVLEIDATMLAFSSDETSGVIDTAAKELAPRIQDVTGGWPVAVQLAAALLESLPQDERAGAVDRITSERGPLVRYLTEEVVEREPPELVHLLQTVALFGSFSGELCEALGVGEAVENLAELERRGFVTTSSEREDFLRLHDVLREFLREIRPLPDAERRAVLLLAARWFEGRGLIPQALDAWSEADEPEEIARLLRENGAELHHRGRSDAIIDAVTRFPEALLVPEVKWWAANAQVVRGDQATAVRYFSELLAAEGEYRGLGFSARLTAGAAFHLADYETQHGDVRKGIELFLGPARASPLSLAFVSGAYLALGELPRAREYATRAIEEARRAGVATVEGEAHLNLGEVYLAEGDVPSAAAEFEASLECFLRESNVLGECSARYRFGELELARGNCRDALEATLEALTLAERIGFTLFERLSRRLRGEILLLVGRLDEAAAEFAAAGFAVGLGDVHRERGELAQAGAAYEAGLEAAERSGQHLERVRALAGLARVLVSDDPEAAAAEAERAVQLGGQPRVAALLARGWVALALGDREAALETASEALAEARLRSDRPGVAESVELQAFCSEPPERGQLEEALTMWRGLGAEAAAARAELALARLAGNRLEAEGAERKLRRLGVGETSSRAAGILMALGPEEALPLELQTLGGFRVLRSGIPVSREAWQSKKARDLLKILVARRGRLVSRDEAIETLWPEEDPARTGNRLSVALSTLRSVLDQNREFPPITSSPPRTAHCDCYSRTSPSTSTHSSHSPKRD